jgi:hypothetical protein
MMLNRPNLSTSVRRIYPQYKGYIRRKQRLAGIGSDDGAALFPFTAPLFEPQSAASSPNALSGTRPPGPPGEKRN